MHFVCTTETTPIAKLAPRCSCELGKLPLWSKFSSLQVGFLAKSVKSSNVCPVRLIWWETCCRYANLCCLFLCSLGRGREGGQHLCNMTAAQAVEFVRNSKFVNLAGCTFMKHNSSTRGSVLGPPQMTCMQWHSQEDKNWQTGRSLPVLLQSPWSGNTSGGQNLFHHKIILFDQTTACCRIFHDLPPQLDETVEKRQQPLDRRSQLWGNVINVRISRGSDILVSFFFFFNLYIQGSFTLCCCPLSLQEACAKNFQLHEATPRDLHCKYNILRVQLCWVCFSIHKVIHFVPSAFWWLIENCKQTTGWSVGHFQKLLLQDMCSSHRSLLWHKKQDERVDIVWWNVINKQ